MGTGGTSVAAAAQHARSVAGIARGTHRFGRTRGHDRDETPAIAGYAPDIDSLDLVHQVSRRRVRNPTLGQQLHHPREARDELLNAPSRRGLCIRVIEPDQSRQRNNGPNRAVAVTDAAT